MVLYTGMAEYLKLARVEKGKLETWLPVTIANCIVTNRAHSSSAASELPTDFLVFCLRPDTMKDERGEENELRLSRAE